MIRSLLLAVALFLVAAVCRADSSAAPAVGSGVAPASSKGAIASSPASPVSVVPGTPGPDTILDPRHLHDGSADAHPATGSSGSLTWLVALACMAGGAWLFIRNRGTRKATVGGALNIAETRSLGNRQYLVVAVCGRKRFLIGVCPGSITMLSALDDSRSGPDPIP